MTEEKITSIEPEGGDPTLKIGARNSQVDLSRIQAMHDTAVDLGAHCGEDEKMIWFGDPVKALPGGKVAGYLVRFTVTGDEDLTGEHFERDTDFGEQTTSPVLYHHGFDAKLGKRKLGQGSLTRDEVGVWIEAQLEMRDEYEKAVYEMAQAGKLGWSSGTASHLVERAGSKITRWPLGLDASLTPTPAEPRNSAVPLKSLISAPEAGDGPAAAVQTNPVITANEENTMDENEIKTLVQEEVGKLETKFSEILTTKTAPAINKTGLGDNETKAYLSFIRTGDRGAMNYKASNNTDMNITTAADGGDLVPTGHYQGIIARRDQSMLAATLGVMNIPGKGTTVDVPYDNEADGEFVLTGETSGFDQDAPALAKKSLTLAKYTKKVTLSYELLEDEDSRLMSFLDDFVGRGMAKTHNNLLITEVAANGTALKTFASASTYAAGELEAMVYDSDLAAYLDGGSVGWVTRAPNYSKIRALTSTSSFVYQAPQGTTGGMRPSLLEYPVHFTDKVAAAAASAKSIFFGNWSMVGKREAPGFTVLRDPYTLAGNGQIVLHYYFRTVYGVLQAEAIGYGTHPTA